jgi:pentapeptide MXKDX repeat protein
MSRYLGVLSACLIVLGLALGTSGCAPTPSTAPRMGGEKMGGDKMGQDKMNKDKMDGMDKDKMDKDKMDKGKMNKDHPGGDK